MPTPTKARKGNSSLGTAKNSAVASGPRRASFEILAGALDVAAAAKRRRGAKQEEMPTPPLVPAEASSEDGNPPGG